MKIAHIHIQQSLLTLHGRTAEELERQIKARGNGTISQLSIFDSTFSDQTQLPECIQFLIIRKSRLKQIALINGKGLKVVEIPHCNLIYFPNISSDFLLKLNVSNNLISEVLQIRYRSLKVLDLRNNRILRIGRDLYRRGLTILHEFISKKLESKQISMPIYLQPNVIKIQNILIETFKKFNTQEILDCCEQIIEHGNQTLLEQILPFISNQMISKVFEHSKVKRRHSLLDLLINKKCCEHVTEEEALDLLMPQYVSQQFLIKSSLSSIIRPISCYNQDQTRVSNFLAYLSKIQNSLNFFIQSEKDLISFMSLNVSYPNKYQSNFLLTQISFFKNYDFGNQVILRYLLGLQNLQLIKYFLTNKSFQDQLFALGLYKKIVKPSKKVYKILLKQDQQYRKHYYHKNELYFPEYRQRKSYCLKNDLYDYQILKEYEEMQCSYIRKDLKYTLKFCNKQNQISIAKRIETQLKRKSLKNMQNRQRNYSNFSSNIFI